MVGYLTLVLFSFVCFCFIVLVLVVYLFYYRKNPPPLPHTHTHTHTYICIYIMASQRVQTTIGCLRTNNTKIVTQLHGVKLSRSSGGRICWVCLWLVLRTFLHWGVRFKVGVEYPVGKNAAQKMVLWRPHMQK